MVFRMTTEKRVALHLAPCWFLNNTGRVFLSPAVQVASSVPFRTGTPSSGWAVSPAPGGACRRLSGGPLFGQGSLPVLRLTARPALSCGGQ